MKFLALSLLIYILQISLSAQTFLEKEITRVKYNPNIKLNYIGNNRVSVNYHNMKTRVYNLGRSVKQNPQFDSIPRFVFDLGQIDTSLFNYKFKFDQEVPIGTTWQSPVLGDINNNGRVEYYGIKKGYYTKFSEVYCYEQNVNGIFKEVYKYPSNTLVGYNIYDVDRDGQQELHLIALHQEPIDSITVVNVMDQTFYKKPSKDSIANQFFFDYNIYTHDLLNGQLNNFTFGDFDKDSTTEAIYYGLNPQTIHLVKFNKNLLTFDSLLTYPTINNEYVVGFTVGDFDIDGKTDIVYASEYGNIYVLENEGLDKYSINWQGNSGIWNSHINFKTNDLDENGKPEFWIGGEDFSEGVTRLVCYETNGDNSYHPLAEIEFPGLLSLNGLDGAGIDVDNDGKEELYIHNGNTIIIMKFTGSINNPDYQLYNCLNIDNLVDYQIENAKIYQFPKEKYPSIIFSMTHFNYPNTELLSRIFKYYLITEVKEENPGFVKGYDLFNNYPNPFNPSTNIRFSIPERCGVKIIVFNSLGEEIITLHNNTLERGVHSISWNSVDKNNLSVPSGVYFITMEAKYFRKTIKSVLIK
jgi:hypothetical protein